MNSKIDKLEQARLEAWNDFMWFLTKQLAENWQLIAIETILWALFGWWWKWALAWFWVTSVLWVVWSSLSMKDVTWLYDKFKNCNSIEEIQEAFMNMSIEKRETTNKTIINSKIKQKSWRERKYWYSNLIFI